jgi:hypothetical protein
LPGMLDGSAIPPILFENDQLNLVGMPVGKFACPIRGAVAHNSNLDFSNVRVADNLIPCVETALNDVLDTRFFVQRWNGDKELHRLRLGASR